MGIVMKTMTVIMCTILNTSPSGNPTSLSGSLTNLDQNSSKGTSPHASSMGHPQDPSTEINTQLTVHPVFVDPMHLASVHVVVLIIVICITVKLLVIDVQFVFSNQFERVCFKNPESPFVKLNFSK